MAAVYSTYVQRGGRFKDLAGTRFGRLVAMRPLKAAGKARLVYWECQCDCGKTHIVCRNSLGRTVSCGCLRKENRIKHGLHGTRAYRVWNAMKNRCQQPASTSYKNYGGRGIKVCERWQQFNNFFADMGAPPLGHQIDRINNDGDYEPGNCRWATIQENGNNKRTNRRFEYRGRWLTLAQLSRVAGLHMDVIGKRLGRGWSVEAAVTGTLQRKRGPPRRYTPEPMPAP